MDLVSLGLKMVLVIKLKEIEKNKSKYMKNDNDSLFTIILAVVRGVSESLIKIKFLNLIKINFLIIN